MLREGRTEGDPGRGASTGRARPETGTGALCPEAQADGVPCPELGRDCAICERALRGDREPPNPGR